MSKPPADWPAQAADLLAARPELLGVGISDAVQAVTSC